MKRLFKKLSKRIIFVFSALLVAGIGIFIYGYFHSKETSAAWFDDSWSYRQTVALTNAGSNQIDYQISFTLDTSNTAKFQADCDDIRVTDISGKLLPHWIESGCSTSSTLIWTKVPSITTSGAIIYVYYGNPSATNIEDGNKVFTFFDDFSKTSVDTTKWTSTGSPAISSGELTLSNSAGIVSNSTQSTNDQTKTLGFRAKTASTTVNTARLGYSNTNTLATAYYNDDAANIVLGPEETYTNSVATTNEKAFYKLEETTSTDANQFKTSGYYDTGKLSQAASVYGNAAETTGSLLTFSRGTQISGNNYERLNGNQGTISFWVKPSWAGNDNLQHIFFQGNVSLIIFKHTDNVLYCEPNSAAASQRATISASSWTANTWYHITCQWDADNTVDGTNYISLLVNGSSTGVTNYSAGTLTAAAPATTYRIGSNNDSSSSTQGLIDELAIYDRVLTSTEISNVYNSGTGREAGYVGDSALKFYAKLDGSGTLSPVTYNAGSSASKMTAKSTELAGGTNLLANGSLEAATGGAATSWIDINSNITEADAATADILYDTRSQKLSYPSTCGGATACEYEQVVTLTGGTSYHLSLWYKVGADTSYIYPRVLSISAGADEIPIAQYPFNSTTWTKWETDFKVSGSGARSVQVGFRKSYGNNTPDLYLENMVITVNSVASGGMEGTLTDNWTQETNATMATDTSEHTGIQEMKITAGAANVGASQAVTLVNNTYYLVSGWARATSGDTANIVVDTGAGATTTIGSVTATSYTKVTGIFQSAGTSGNIYLRGAANTDIVWFDDVSIIALDNVSTSFQAWTPVDDGAATNNSNDLSVHGDSDGVASTTSGARGNGYTFDGSTGYLRQKTYDINIGTLTYADTNTDISDDGQEFEEWDNDDGGGAEYMIVVTESDNTTSWGYFCANDGGTQTAVYTKQACTGGSEGFTGTIGTPVGYEIRKTDFQNTGNITVGAWVKTSDSSGTIVSKWGSNSDDTDASFELGVGNVSGGKATIYVRNSGSSVYAMSSNTINDNSWHFIVGTYTSGSSIIYVDGVNVGTGAPSGSIIDTPTPLTIGSASRAGIWYLSGSIDSPFVLSTNLSAAQIKALYHASGSKYGVMADNGAANTLTETSTAIDAATYHNFEITQKASSASISVDGGTAATSSTNSPNSAQYVRFDNSDASNAVTVDWVYVRKTAATEPTIGSPATEEQGPGPIAYWNFDDGQGQTTQDSTSSNNDGTLGADSGASTDDPTWTTEDQCISGKCLKFDGGDFVERASTNSLKITGALTISTWVKFPSSTATDQKILTKRSANDGYILGINGTSEFYGGISDASGWDVLDGIDISSYTNKWTHVVMTYSDTDNMIYLYLDGVQKDSKNTTRSLTTSDEELTIGSQGDYAGAKNQFFTGFIDEPKVYNFARTAAQVKADFLAGSGAASKQGSSSTLGAKTQEFLSEGLTGYWKMNDSGIDAEGETITDSSGNTNTGTLYGDNGVGDNGTGLDCTAVGKYGSGCSLDGTDDYMEATDTNNLDIGTGDYSVSVWFTRTTNATTNLRLLSKGAAAEAQTGWAFFGSDTSLTAIIGNGTARIAVSGNHTGTSTWNHATMVVKRNDKLYLYINGSLAGSTSISSYGTTDLGSAYNLFFGRNAADSQLFWPGKIDDIRLYNRALSSKEVSDLYSWAPGPVGYWNFDEKSGASTFDTSGGGNTGTITNATWNTGKFGSGLSFDGNGDFVNIPQTTTLDTPTGTVSMWAYFSDLTDNGYLWSQNIDEWSIYNNGAALKGYYDSAAAITYTPAFSANQWVHLSFTFNKGGSGTCYLYVNGVQASSGNCSSTAPTLSNIRIGAESDNGAASFNGIIDDVRVYNYQRTSKQVIEDMNGGHPAVGSPVGSALGYWKFDEGQGITANNSGNGGSTYNATLTGSSLPTWTNSGKFGKALSLNGTTAYIDSGSNFNYTSEDFTISYWINLNSLTTNVADQGPVPIYKGGYQANGYYSQINANGGIGFSTNQSGANQSSSAPSGTISTGTWYQITYIRTGTSVRIYVNGVDKTTTAATHTNPSSSSDTFQIGRYQGTGTPIYTNGIIDEIKVYNYALTADEVKLDYNRGSSLVLGALSDSSSGNQPQSAAAEYCIPGDSTSCAAPVARLDFNERNGTTVYDSSGNANNGTLASSPTTPHLDHW